MYWFFYGAGILFAITGIWLFYRNALEKERGIFMPVVLMVMGVILIAIGTAKNLDLIH